MAIPVLKLNLAPAPSLLGKYHVPFSWMAIGIGAFALGLVATLTVNAYRQGEKLAEDASKYAKETRSASAQYLSIQNELRAIDVQKELPRWKLAERILTERASPWTRLLAELERDLVQDVRIRNFTRSRGSDQKTIIKVKGEARSAEAEAKFIEALQANAYFDPVILDREAERQGGGFEFELNLGISQAPPVYETLPKFGPSRAKTAEPPAKAPIKAGSDKSVQDKGIKVKSPVKPIAASAPASPARPQNTETLTRPTPPQRPTRDIRESLERMNRGGLRRGTPPEREENQ